LILRCHGGSTKCKPYVYGLALCRSAAYVLYDRARILAWGCAGWDYFMLFLLATLAP